MEETGADNHREQIPRVVIGSTRAAMHHRVDFPNARF
jgi:hypothetical protein